MEIYERQLEIMENENTPYFTLEKENIWENVKNTDKIAKTKYTLTNNGGRIKNVYCWVESYIIFYVPTGIEDEWYIFRYQTYDFGINNHSGTVKEEEIGKKYVFYEYTSGDEKYEIDTKALKLGKYLSNNFNKGITHSYRNVLNIIYTDYMGDEKRKSFGFIDTELQELEKDLEGVSVGVSLDALITSREGEIIRTPIDINDMEAVGKALKEDIDKWLEENQGAKGYKSAAHVLYNYDLVE